MASLPRSRLHFPKLQIVASHEHVGEHDFVDDFFRFVKQGTEQKERGITEFGWLGLTHQKVGGGWQVLTSRSGRIVLVMSS